jgi:hypothetical protein
VEGESKTQQRVLTTVGVVLGVVVGFVVFRRMIADKEGVLEIGDFLIGVFAGGAVGIVIYLLIKDGIRLLLKGRGPREPRAPRQPRAARAPGGATPQASAPPPTPTPAAPRRKEPLRAAGRERPLRTERPLKPRD